MDDSHYGHNHSRAPLSESPLLLNHFVETNTTRLRLNNRTASIYGLAQEKHYSGSYGKRPLKITVNFIVKLLCWQEAVEKAFGPTVSRKNLIYYLLLKQDSNKNFSYHHHAQEDCRRRALFTDFSSAAQPINCGAVSNKVSVST